MSGRITGNNFSDILCIGRDSPLFYQMKKCKKDLQEAKETLSRFDVAVH